MEVLTVVLFFVIGGGAFAGGYFLSRVLKGKQLQMTEKEAESIKDMARREADTIKKEAELQAKDTLLKLRHDFEQDTKTRREELSVAEKRILQKEESVEKRLDLLDKKEKDLTTRIDVLRQKEADVIQKNDELTKLIQQEKDVLHRISNLSREEAKNILLSRIDEELVHEKATRIRSMEEEIKETSDKKARELLSVAIQRCASDHAAETTISVVQLPSDEMKGRIIGREGRNIRALEQATGVDIIIDDTPEAVTISGFDMVRREVARISLEALIADGRIHPGRIEEVVEKAKKELEAKIKQEGENAVFELGIHNMHPELVKLIGRLKYRTSFGQNALQHTKEVARLSGLIAHQLGLDPAIAKRSGLLHDIGKVVSDEIEEGTHAVVGGRLARKFGESEVIANAVESHHSEVEVGSLYGTLVCISDTVSASRPGARAESLETYIKRLENLEKIATSFKGIDKVYALQAGREIRILVDPSKLNDDESVVLARDIRKKIEAEMEYPGQIKVLVVRETRAMEYAK
ncbi:MAG: ribonuclease Y [Candidatus Omnitrophica bacterium]|nr:ribonuclease Y [Candidatus Omnitrophota bacterium]